MICHTRHLMILFFLVTFCMFHRLLTEIASMLLHMKSLMAGLTNHLLMYRIVYCTR